MLITRGRAAVLRRYDEAVLEWHQLRMAPEGAQGGVPLPVVQ